MNILKKIYFAVREHYPQAASIVMQILKSYSVLPRLDDIEEEEHDYFSTELKDGEVYKEKVY